MYLPGIKELRLTCLTYRLVSPSDMELLITSAASVVLRRDMSLNRRLWVWFLGPDPQDHTAAPSSPHRPDYFNKYALQGLIRGLRNMIESDRMEPAERAKPSRICLSLMDRWEIGGLVVPGLFMPIVRSVCAFEKSAPSKEQYIEVLKSVAVFFDGVESALIWGEIYDTISSALTTSKKTEESLENLRLVSFILKTFNVREEEMLVVHAPLVLLALLLMLQNVGPKESFKLIPTGFGLAVELLALIPERAFLGEILEETLLPSETDVVPILNKYYASPSSKTESIPFSSHLIGRLLLRLVSDLVCHATVPQQADIGIRCKLLVETIKKIPTVVEWDGKPLLDATLQGLQSSEVQFTTLQGSAQVIATLYDRGYLSHGQINSLIPTFVEQIWRFLSPDTPKYHVEAVNSLWAIQAVLNDRRVEAAIAAVLVSDDINGVYEMRPAESGRKFSVLWTHSVGNPKYEMMLTRPLFLFLDSLVEEVTELHIFTRGWLQSLVATNK